MTDWRPIGRAAPRIVDHGYGPISLPRTTWRARCPECKRLFTVALAVGDVTPDTCRECNPLQKEGARA